MGRARGGEHSGVRTDWCRRGRHHGAEVTRGLGRRRWIGRRPAQLDVHRRGGDDLEEAGLLHRVDIDRNNLYKKLRSLEKDGILKSQLKSSQQGADRKYYTITPFGKKLFNEMYQLLIPVMASLHKRTRQIN